jgi:hypothetical protein
VQLCNSLGILFAPLLPFTAQEGFLSFFGNNFETDMPNYTNEKKNFWKKCEKKNL